MGGDGGSTVFYGVKGFSYTVVAVVNYKSKTGTQLSPIRKTAVVNINQPGGAVSCPYPSSLTWPAFPAVIPYAGPNGENLYQQDGEIFVLFPNDNRINVNIVLLYREKGSNQEWARTSPLPLKGAWFPGTGYITLIRIVGLKPSTEYEIKAAIQCNDKLAFAPDLFYASTFVI